MKKPLPPEASKLDSPTIFCTECGAELENFCFSSGAADIDAIKRTLAQCKKNGKFLGEFCSKLFVASTEESRPEPDESG